MIPRVVAAVLALLLGLATAGPAAAGVLPPPDPASQLIPCSQADVRTVITVPSHLDPSCSYTKGFDIRASGVTLDCQGALIDGSASGGDGSRGIEIETPSNVDMSDITVRNCRIDGFLNNIRATRTGFRALAAGHEFDNQLTDITIEDSQLTNSRGVGLFVDGYVDDVTIRNLLVQNAGSTGIYLEAGSKDNTVQDNVIVDNGYRENGRPEGQTFVFSGITFRFWGPGREGLAIDGSRNNHVSGNYFEGNQNGSIFLYTNCGEFVTQRPDRWFQRRYGADDNLIEENEFVGGPNGVWVGSRMGENTLPMECSDPAYHTGPLLRVALDRAANNTVRNNTFEDVMYGVRVEDDGTTVEGNSFTAPDDTHHAVVVGTTWRTTILDHPVRNTTVRNNTSSIVGNTHPYRWVHGQESTVTAGNRALGQPVPICEGEALPVNAMIFVLHAVVEDPNGPPTPKPDFPVPTLGSLPPCDPLPHIVPGKGTIAEGGASDANVVEVPVTLSEPSTSPVTASWTTLHQPGLKGNPAEPGTDYVPASGYVTFAPGETATTVPVELVGDADVEANEYVLVSLANPIGGHIGGFLGLGFGTITNDDLPVTIVPGSASVTEGDAGTTTLEFPVTLDRLSSDEVSADWATLLVGAGHPVEAVPGTDYEAVSGTVTFAPGETEAVVTITVNGDVDLEEDELFLVRLTNPIGGRLGGLFGLGFAGIVDDD